jgi:hypothetical protein
LADYASESNWYDTVGWLQSFSEYLTLDFILHPEDTQLYSTFNGTILSETAYTFNYHKRGIDPSLWLTDQALFDFWIMTATSYSSIN